MQSYEKARELYQELVGKEHPSYLTTLTNLGVLLRIVGERGKGLQARELTDACVGGVAVRPLTALL